MVYINLIWPFTPPQPFGGRVERVACDSNLATLVGNSNGGTVAARL